MVPHGWIRTSSLRFRKPLLFPVELRGREAECPQADSNRQPSPPEGDALSFELQGPERWGDGRDLNPQPPGSQPGALPVELPSQRKWRDSNPQPRADRDDGLASRCITVLPHFLGVPSWRIGATIPALCLARAALFRMS